MSSNVVICFKKFTKFGNHAIYVQFHFLYKFSHLIASFDNIRLD